MSRRANSWTVLTAVLIVSSATTSPLGAETWLVLPDGTGDVPTIQDAYDIAEPGDDILLGPGIFREGDIIPTPGIPLSTQEGPGETVLDAAGYDYGVWGVEQSTPWAITGLTIRNSGSASAGARR